MQVDVRTEDLRQLARDLRGKDNKALRAKMSKSMRAPLKDAQKAVRAKIRTIPSQGGRSSGHSARHGHKLREGQNRSERFGTLRSRLAAAVNVKVNTSRNVTVKIYMDVGKLPDDQRTLPWYVEGLKPWRHPTYGHNPWVTQKAHPYFFATVRPYRERVQANMRQVLDELRAELTRGGP